MAVRRVLAGDLDAFDDLYRIYAGPLLSFLATQVRRREDAEDLVGQVFLEAIRGIERFQGDAAAFRAWLFRIGRDRAVDLARRQSRRPEEPIEAAGDVPNERGTEDEALAAIERRAVRRAVMDLPEAQREVIALRLASGLSSGEIARVVGKDVNAVKALQHRALAGLAKALGKQKSRIASDPYPPPVPGRLEG